MKNRVFHFILDHRVGGPHIYVQHLAKALETDVDSLLVTTGRGAQTDITLLNLRHWLRCLYPFEVILNVLGLCWRFRRHKLRERVIFDVHGAANLAPIVAARILNIPLVWHFHETVAKFSLLVALGKNIALGIPHKLIVVAKKAAQVFNLPNAILIPGAVDPTFWSVAHFDKSSCKGAQQLRILCVCNLNPLKGVDTLLASLEEVTQPWELVIVGADLQTYSSYARKLRAHAARLESPNRRTRFAGWQSQEEVRNLMVNSDVFVLPSRSEACPLALLEAMAAGCACIATDVGDVREILGALGSGIVVPRESSSALAVAIEHVAEISAADRQRMGKLAQEVVLDKYSTQAQAEKHLGIYKQVTSMSKGTS